MEFHEMTFSFVILQGIRIHTEPLDHSKRSWDATIRLCPHEHMCSFRMEELEIPEIIVCGRLYKLVTKPIGEGEFTYLSLRDFSIRLGFSRMD